MARFAARIPSGTDPDALRDALLLAGFRHLDAAEIAERCDGHDDELSTTVKRLTANGIRIDVLAQSLREIGVEVRCSAVP
jgi:hypothetical protein